MDHIDQLPATQLIVQPAPGDIETLDNAIEDVERIPIAQVRQGRARKTDIDGGDLFLRLRDFTTLLGRERLRQYLRKGHGAGGKRGKDLFYGSHCRRDVDIADQRQHHVAWYSVALIKGDHILTLQAL